MIYAINTNTKEHRVIDNMRQIPQGVEWKIAGADEDGWIPWKGGECPLPDGHPCDVLHIDGERIKGTRVDGEGAVRWSHSGQAGDIIAYRPILETEPEAPEWDGEGLPPVGCMCEHHSGRVCRVTGYANENTSRPQQYPVTIIYQNVDNGTTWARPVDQWLRSFRPIRSAEDKAVEEMVLVIGQAVAGGAWSSARALYRAGYRKQ